MNHSLPLFINVIFNFIRLAATAAFLYLVFLICLVLLNSNPSIFSRLQILPTMYVDSFRAMWAAINIFLISLALISVLSAFATSASTKKIMRAIIMVIYGCQIVALALFVQPWGRGPAGHLAIILPVCFLALSNFQLRHWSQMLKDAGVILGLFAMLLALANESAVSSIGFLQSGGAQIQTWGTIVILFCFGLVIGSFMQKPAAWWMGALIISAIALGILWFGAPLTYTKPLLLPETDLELVSSKRVDDKHLLVILGLACVLFSLVDAIRRKRMIGMKAGIQKNTPL